MGDVEQVYGRKTYNARLKDAGIDMPSADFQDVVVEAWHDLFPDFTDEEICLRPSECAALICAEVRKRIGRADCPEDLIMRHLTKPRKQNRDKE